ncbi:MAG: SpoIIE family protein phosphatase [Candidatus Nanopelagicales bacterium]
MSLRARVWIVLLTAAALILGCAWALRSGYLTVVDTAEHVANTLQPASDTVADLDFALAEMRAGATVYALTGNVKDLATYVDANTRAQNAFRKLDEYLAGDEELSALLRKTRIDTAVWRREGMQPVIEATRSGDQATATELVSSGQPRQMYYTARSSLHQLNQELRDNVDDAVARQTDEFVWLWRVLNISILLLLVLMAAIAVLLIRSVLRPLRDLGRQLVVTTAAENHEIPIVPSGPPEVRQVGADAEGMRRQLVAEIDRARQADEGLEQHTPVLAAIRAELGESHAPFIPQLDVAGVQQPAEGVMAGDWWSAQEIANGCLALVVTDVSGHGPQAGIEALRLKHVVELSLAQHGDPGLAMAAAASGFRDASRFATCAVVVLNPATGMVHWANAGHHPPWIMNGDVTVELVSTGPLLSILGGEWSTQQTQLEPGAALVMWTDGLTESSDDQRTELGDEGLRALVAAALGAEDTSAGVVAHILAAARARAVDWRRDDVTLVVAQRQ